MSQSLDLGPIPRKKQKNKVSETSITGNQVTQDPYDTNKKAKVGSSIEGTKQTSVCVTTHPSGLTPPLYKNKQDYKGGTNDKTHDSHTHKSGVYRSNYSSVARNLDAENNNAEDGEYIDHPSIKNDGIDSQSHEKIRNRLLLKRFSLKVIDLVLSNIDQYEKEIWAVDYINKKIETKDEWNQINVLNMHSMLGDNCRMPLLHMSKSYIWLEETNQRINDFSIGYMMNQTLYKDRAFKVQVKVCFKHIFVPDTTSHINKILQKKIQEC